MVLVLGVFTKSARVFPPFPRPRFAQVAPPVAVTSLLVKPTHLVELVQGSPSPKEGRYGNPPEKLKMSQIPLKSCQREDEKCCKSHKKSKQQKFPEGPQRLTSKAH